MTSAFLPFGEDVEDICGKEELVSFSDMSSQYPANQSVTVKYQLGSRVQASPFDWIGIFQDQWEDVSQPLAHISHPFTERSHGKVRRKSVTFSATAIKALEPKASSFQFVYVNANQHILGVSVPFKFKDDIPTRLDLTEKGEEGERDSECSDSPVILSSASEDEEEWDTSRHSNTLRQAYQACPGDPSVQDELGGSSASDLSDIVVLSTSPSQEAARLAAEQQHVTGEVRLAEIFGKIWSLGASGGNGEDSQETAGEAGGQGRRQEALDDVNSPRGKNSKILFSHSEEKPLVKKNGGEEIKDVSEDKGVLSLEDISVVVELPTNSNTLEGKLWKRDSLLQQLRIVELDSTSEEEDNKEERESLKTKDVSKETLKKNRSSKLITEITESEAKFTKKPTPEKVKAKPIAAADAKKDIPQETVTSLQNTPNTSSSKETPKKAKKKKRDKKSDREKNDNEDGEVKKVKQPYHAPLDALFRRAGKSDHCYENEVFSGWSVGEYDHAVKVKNSLAFDELLEASINTLKHQVRHAKRQEQPKCKKDAPLEARVVNLEDNEGELYSCCMPSASSKENITNIDGKEKLPSKPPSKPKRAKKIKLRKMLKSQEEEESTPIKTSTNAENLDTMTFETSGNDSKLDHPELIFPKEAVGTTENTSHGSTNPAQEATPNRKCRRDVKAKAAKKAKRATSSKRKRRAQLSCDFQYLFSVDVKRGQSEREEAALESETPDVSSKPCQISDTSILPILDTSEAGFPALPSQQENSKTNTCQNSKEALNGDNGEEKTEIEEDEEKEPEMDEEEDILDNACLEALPVGVGARGEILPYIPPYVLDVMDALPPASVSPDGRAMIEWKRSLLPLLPKHTLPVFHSKYKAKYGRKFDLKRSKLKRAAVNRNCGIIDRIRHQLAVPGSLEQVVKNWQKSQRAKDLIPKLKEDSLQACDPQADEKSKDLNLVPKPAAPLSYASIVKKALDAKEVLQAEGVGDRDDPTCSKGTKDGDSGEHGTSQHPNPCQVVDPPSLSSSRISPLEPNKTTENSCVTKEGHKSTEHQTKAMCEISDNFPKEYTGYTSKEKTKGTPSNLQHVPTNKETPSQLCTLPSPIFLTPPITADSETGEKPSASCEARNSQQSQRLETPGLHIRPIAKSQPKTLSGSPPRKAKGHSQPCNKKKASAPCEYDQINGADEQKALMDMALSSCLADNAELRTTVVSLEKQVTQLKSEQQRFSKTKQEKEIRNSELEQKCVPKAKTSETSKLSPHRKVPVCKWAGKMARMVRSNVEVISLSTKVKGYEQEIASLTNQVNALKEALQMETKRSRRALTKWFKAKLKVKVLRSRIRELQVLESAPSTGEASSSSLPCTSEPQQATSDTSVHTERVEETTEDWEPPCKRQKLEHHTNEDQSKELNDTDAPEVVRKASPLLPPPVPPRPQEQPVQQHPLRAPYASPPIGPFFNFFAVNSGENGRLTFDQPLAQPQQAVVPPLYHNNNRQNFQDEKNNLHLQQQQQQLRQQQQHFQHINNYANTVQQHPNLHQLLNPQTLNTHYPLFNDPVNSTRRQISQRKKSPPHLPLPTPPRAPMTPPSCYLLPRQQTDQWNKAKRTHHSPARQSPTAIHPANQTGFLYPPAPNSSCQLPGWGLQQSNPHAMENLSNGRRNGAPLLSPWGMTPPLSPPWNAIDLDRPSTLHPALYTHPDNQNPLWLQNMVQSQADNFVKPVNYSENNFYHQEEIFQTPQNSLGIFNEPVTPDAYFKEEASQAGPLRKPLSCAQPQAPSSTLGKQVQTPSPPGKYRSDFLRRLMKREAAQSQWQPNPYRLFNRQLKREQNHNQGSVGLYPTLPCMDNPESQDSFTTGTESLTPSTTAVTSPQLLAVRKPEASYRNTSAFVELTADGLVEATRIEMESMPFIWDSRYDNSSRNDNNNGWNCIGDTCEEKYILTKPRPIESQTASDFLNL